MNLNSLLPHGQSYSVLHLRTKAYECKPLLISKNKPFTLKVKHLLLLTENTSGCIVYGIEVYIYLTFHGLVLQRHVFVLKADTTGLSSRRISIAGLTKKFLSYLINLDPTVYLQNASLNRRKIEASEFAENDECNTSEFDTVNLLRGLSKRLHDDPSFYSSLPFYKEHLAERLQFNQDMKLPVEPPTLVETKISLFTRAAHAYLFPDSDKNKSKHVADSGQLFKWWLGVLDAILNRDWIKKADIPGSDYAAVKRYLPASNEWVTGNIYVNEHNDEKAVYAIPLFPDDPKGRFLEHLIVENRYKKLTASQFWNELGFRQEFRLGNVVGIIGCASKSEAVGGASELDTTCISLRDYKKIVECVKGENYSSSEDARAFWGTGLPEVFQRSRIDFLPIQLSGTQVVSGTEVTKPVISLPSVKRKNAHDNLADADLKVNNLTTSIKRKPPTSSTGLPVNNLNGLVKRKK